MKFELYIVNKADLESYGYNFCKLQALMGYDLITRVSFNKMTRERKWTFNSKMMFWCLSPAYNGIVHSFTLDMMDMSNNRQLALGKVVFSQVKVRFEHA